jgi:hypothetical protein
MSGRGMHRGGTVVLSIAMVAIGIALVVESVAAGSALSLLALIGILFAAAGVGRLYAESRRGGDA